MVTGRYFLKGAEEAAPTMTKDALMYLLVSSASLSSSEESSDSCSLSLLISSSCFSGTLLKSSARSERIDENQISARLSRGH